MDNGVTVAVNLRNSFVILTNNGCAKLKLVIAIQNQSQNYLIDPGLQGVNSLLYYQLII